MSQILMMSSDPIVKQKCLEVLINAGFKITDVSDALDGLLMVDKDGFSTIIIDEELADMDGYRACQKVRQHSQVPIILLGTEPSENIWSRVDELGFDVYLKKPVSSRELVARIKSVTKYARAKATVESQGESIFEESVAKEEPATQLPVTEIEIATSEGVEDMEETTEEKHIEETTIMSEQSESIGTTLTELERQVSKIKMTIGKIAQLQNTVDEATEIIHQQQSNLAAVEKQLQEVSMQLRNISGSSAK